MQSRSLLTKVTIERDGPEYDHIKINDEYVARDIPKGQNIRVVEEHGHKYLKINDEYVEEIIGAEENG